MESLEIHKLMRNHHEAIHPTAVEIFHIKRQPHGGFRGKGLTKVSQVHPLGTLNVCTTFDGSSPSKSLFVKSFNRV